jgi:SAM-dependent methyltransferase
MRNLQATRRSAQAVVPRMMELVQPGSVIDVGCGLGSWLNAFVQAGVDDVLGIDGNEADPALLEIPMERFLRRDLTQPLRLERQFDLVVSLEVAEHLPPAAAEPFVQQLAGLGPVVLFSAAVPHQGGVEHLNEQWQEYWAERFEAQGFVTVDCLRRRIWDDPDVSWWYKQNMLLFARPDRVEALPQLKQEALRGGRQLSLVHPQRFLEWVQWGMEQAGKARR